MITLFLDTSTVRLVVAIYKDNECIYLKNEDSFNDLSSKTLPLIDEAITSLKISIDDIDKIIVVNGPGSFTGVRVGVTIAKTLAYTKNISIITVSSLEVMSTTKVKTEYIVPLIDARRGYFFTGMYKNGKNIFPDSYLSKEKLFNRIKRYTSLKNVTFVSYTKLDFETIYPDINIEKIIKKYKRRKSLIPHAVNPNYLKKVEAVEKLNDKRDK